MDRKNLEEKLKNALSAQIDYITKRDNITQKGLAKRVGISESKFSMLKNANNYPGNECSDELFDQFLEGIEIKDEEFFYVWEIANQLREMAEEADGPEDEPAGPPPPPPSPGSESEENGTKKQSGEIVLVGSSRIPPVLDLIRRVKPLWVLGGAAVIVVFLIGFLLARGNRTGEPGIARSISTPVVTPLGRIPQPGTSRLTTSEFENLASTVSIVCSSQQDSGTHRCTNLVDGNSATSWVAGEVDAASVNINLAQEYYLDSIRYETTSAEGGRSRGTTFKVLIDGQRLNDVTRDVLDHEWVEIPINSRGQTVSLAMELERGHMWVGGYEIQVLGSFRAPQKTEPGESQPSRNLALELPVTCSSQQDAGERRCSHLTDGDSESYWASAGPEGSSESAAIDLGDTYYIETVRFQMEGPGRASPPEEISLKVSVDGQTVNIVSARMNAYDWKEIPVGTSGQRVVMDLQGPTWWPGGRQIEVMGFEPGASSTFGWIDITDQVYWELLRNSKEGFWYIQFSNPQIELLRGNTIVTIEEGSTQGRAYRLWVDGEEIFSGIQPANNNVTVINIPGSGIVRRFAVDLLGPAPQNVGVRIQTLQ